MKNIILNEKKNNASNKSESLSSNDSLKPILKPELNIVQFSELIEQDEKKDIKFITKKRGRKNINQDDTNNTNLENIAEVKNVHDKSYSDNIRRKIKSLYHKYIINLLNSLIKQKFKRITMKFLKMKLRITKDVGIEYNRELLNSSIKSIIVNVSKKFKNQDNNINVIKFIETQKDNEKILQILNMTYKDLYTNYYLKSTKNSLLNNSFEDHKEKLLKKFGKEYLQLFIENSEKFVDFYINGKKRKSRKPREVESIFISSENEIKESSVNELININNVENYFLQKNMVSCGTETDISGVDKKLLAFS